MEVSGFALAVESRSRMERHLAKDGSTRVSAQLHRRHVTVGLDGLRRPIHHCMSNLLYHGLNYRLRRTGGNELGSAASVIASQFGYSRETKMFCYCVKHLRLVISHRTTIVFASVFTAFFSLRYRGEVSLAYFRSDS